jgi:carbamoyltransferase
VRYILGISAFSDDSAAALLGDGEILAAVEENRYSRKACDSRFPKRAVDACLAQAGIVPEQLEYVSFHEQPLAEMERLVETYLAYAPVGFSSFRQTLPLWLREKLHVPRLIRRGLGKHFRGKILFPAAHQSHAAAAFFPSPFETAGILIMDGAGEWSSTVVGHGKGHEVKLIEQIRFPHSLGLLCSAFAYYCGFDTTAGEDEFMALSTQGEPSYAQTIYDNLVDLKPDGSYYMDQSYFNYCQGLTMTSGKFHRLLGGPPRRPGSPLEQRHKELASSVQRVCEEVVLRSAHRVWERTGRPQNLVMAGRVALNAVANGRLLREGPFENLWIQPASGDAAGALGAALFGWHQILAKGRQPGSQDRQKGSLLGPAYSSAFVRESFAHVRAKYHEMASEDELLDHVATALADGKIVGWFQGRSEYGPRSLGARSILVDARNPHIEQKLGMTVNPREILRPLDACVLRENAHEWFGVRCGEESPYKLIVALVLKRSQTPSSAEDRGNRQHDPDRFHYAAAATSLVPAVTHADGTARIQTVDERSGRYYRLLRRFHARTGVPVIASTSFRLSWEPPVLTPMEAYHTFMQSGLDTLVVEDCVLHKVEQRLGLSPLGSRCRGRFPDPDSPWIDGRTGEPLCVTPTCLKNPVTGVCYPIEDGIPRLFVPTDDTEVNGHDVTETVKQFYETTPFPNYDSLDSPLALAEKARSGLFASLLNDQIAYDARVLEVGCGTGQLTNFLAMSHRSVLGVDMCLNSLRLGQGFKAEHSLDRATFAQMNLFRPFLRSGFFDVVISNGVLMVTADPRRALASIARLAKPGGFIVVGLYSSYSRKLHQARMALFHWTGITHRWLDPHFGRVSSRGKHDAWFQDQYCHPHETCHTLDEVLGWMEESSLVFVNSIPKPEVGPVLQPGEQLFEPKPVGSPVSRFLSQVADFGSGYREGGFFIVIAQRRSEARP